MIRPRNRAAVGIAGAAAIGASAYRARALTRGGVLAATAVGGAAFAGSGLRGSAALVAFFLSSTLLGRLQAGDAAPQRRGNQRDAVQVLANGGVAALLALAASLGPVRARRILLDGFGGAVATATADTWATEVGTRSGQSPRSLTTLTPVAPGTSGAVTVAGLGASAAGAAMIGGLLADRCRGNPCRRPGNALAIAIGGIAGALADSALGATVQEVRACDACGQETELHVHHCGAVTRRIRGAGWCNNDTVNVLATGAGAATAMAFAAAFDRWQGESAGETAVTRRSLRYRIASQFDNTRRHESRVPSPRDESPRYGERHDRCPACWHAGPAGEIQPSSTGGLSDRWEALK